MRKHIFIVSAAVVAALLSWQPLSHRPYNPKQIIVTTGDVTNITAKGATCSYRVTWVNERFEHGVCVNKTPNPEVKKNSSLTFTGTCEKSVAQQRACSASMLLKSKVMYYVRAFEKLSNGTIVYGNQKSFTTL